MSTIRIGDQILPHGVALAPLAGVSDRPFRALARRFGAEYTVSEMVSAKALVYEQNLKKEPTPRRVRTAPLATVYRDELPMAVQLFGAEPEFMAKAAALIESGDFIGNDGDAHPTAIDINMGCPMAKIVGNGEGAALMKDPARAEAIVSAMVKAVSLPVTVKMRIGWDADHINAVEFARRMEAAGAAAICVHGRTRAQMYAPAADWEIIRQVREALSIPVFGNGDIFSAQDALRMMQITGCQGVMVARGAQGNPWIFRSILRTLQNKPDSPPKVRERLEIALEHTQMLIAEKGEHIGVSEARKHLAWYTHGLRGSAAVRGKLMTASTLDEIKSLLQTLKMVEV